MKSADRPKKDKPKPMPTEYQPVTKDEPPPGVLVDYLWKDGTHGQDTRPFPVQCICGGKCPDAHPPSSWENGDIAGFAYKPEGGMDAVKRCMEASAK